MDESNIESRTERFKRLGRLWLGKPETPLREFEGYHESRFSLIFGYVVAVVIMILDILASTGILVSGNKAAQNGIGSINIIFYLGIFITMLVFWLKGYEAFKVNPIFNVVFMGILFVTSLLFMSASIAQYRENPDKRPVDVGELVMSVFNLILVIVFLIMAIYYVVNPINNDITLNTPIGYPFLTLFPLFKLVTAIISITRANTTRSVKVLTKEPQKEPTKETSKEPLKETTKENTKETTKTSEKAPSITSSSRGPPRPKSPTVPKEPVDIEKRVKKEREVLMSPKK